MRLVNKLKTILEPHYLIIGGYTGLVIGCCRGESGKRDVLEEEPLASFKRCSPRKCYICQGLEEEELC